VIYLGIDPGLDGALAYIKFCGDHVQPHVEVVDTPTVTVKRTGGRKKREYDLAAMSKTLSALAIPRHHEMRAVIEKVHAMPGQGVASMFSMGYGCGLWEGLLSGLGIPYERVAPQRWQKLMLADEGKGKDAARLQAQRLFPQYAHLFARKKDDGRADALLIAEYGRRTAA
jgi:crossover junction endodeoxyribonuclease RuvC